MNLAAKAILQAFFAEDRKRDYCPNWVLENCWADTEGYGSAEVDWEELDKAIDKFCANFEASKVT